MSVSAACAASRSPSVIVLLRVERGLRDGDTRVLAILQQVLPAGVCGDEREAQLPRLVALLLCEGRLVAGLVLQLPALVGESIGLLPETLDVVEDRVLVVAPGERGDVGHEPSPVGWMSRTRRGSMMTSLSPRSVR